MEVLYEQFIRERQYLLNVSEKTVEAYRWAWKAFEPALKGKPSVAKVDLLQRISELRAGGLCAVTVNTYLRSVNAFCHWMVLEGHTDTPTKVPRLKEERKVLQTFSDTQTGKLVSFRGETFGEHWRYNTSSERFPSMFTSLRLTMGMLVVLVALVTAVGASAQSTAQSTNKVQSKATSNQTTVSGRLVKIDVENKTLQVEPWDKTEKRFKSEVMRTLSWSDTTIIKVGSSSATMAQFLSGKSLQTTTCLLGCSTKQYQTVEDLKGELFDFRVAQANGGASVVQMSGVYAFAGMTLAIP